MIDDDKLVERLLGPHEWGYRDPVVGGFVSDDAPFQAGTALQSQADRIEAFKQHAPDALLRPAGEVGEMIERWQRGPENGVNCPTCGCRVPSDYFAPCPDCGTERLAASDTEAMKQERFLVAYVSQDAKTIGIEHETEADWNDVQRAHEALRDRLTERLAEREKCPFKPALDKT